MESSGLAAHSSTHVSMSPTARRLVLPRICFVGHQTEQWAEIRCSIESRHIDVRDVLNFDQVLEQYSSKAPDLIIVSENGESLPPHEVCSDLRRRGYAGPVLVITGVSDPVDRILALESGADAWAPANIDPRTAVAQIRALLRRADNVSASIQEDGDTMSIKIGDCQLCNLSRECIVDGQLVHLTGREFQLLWVLAQRTGKVVSREEIARLFGADGLLPTGRAIDCCVARVRKRLGRVYRKYIKTIHGTGYMMSSTSLHNQTSVASSEPVSKKMQLRAVE